MKAKTSQYVLMGLSLAGLCAVTIWVLTLPPKWKVIGSYTTSLRERTASQAYNAGLAARQIDGTVLEPGGAFSFNSKVGSWSKDAGYEKAPVSYDGELVENWGGGVCQTSTTLYGAALYAGLQIIERHRHHWPARYAPPGMDAAVAYSNIDLRFRNSLPWPVKIEAKINGEKLTCRILCSHKPAYVVKVKREIRSVTPAHEVVQVSPHERAYRLISPGQPGMQVTVYRSFSGNSTRQEIVSDDSYPAMNRIVRVRQPI